VRQLKLYRHGVTMATLPGKIVGATAKRGNCVGWSSDAARRNANFLRSVDERELDGYGYAVTLTVRECPATPEAWTKAQRAWIERQSRAGMMRLHWVVEMQRRGVPHLHAAIWYRDAPDAVKILRDWIDIAAPWSPSPKGQHVKPIEGVVGWFAYMSKHCSRSHKHYQRQRESLPDAWEKSPRVWGYRGGWKLVEPVPVSVSGSEFYRMRRLLRRRRISQARQKLYKAALPADCEGVKWYRVGDVSQPWLFHRVEYVSVAFDPWRDKSGALVRSLGERLVKPVCELASLVAARRMLKCPIRELSEVRGASEWIESGELDELLSAMVDQG